MEASDLGPKRPPTEKQGDDAEPKKQAAERSKTWLDLLQRIGESVVPALLTAGGFVGFLAFAGSIIVWTRFQAAEVPPDQAVAVYPRSELVAVASALLLVFGFAGVLAVLGFFLIRRKGGASIGVSRGLLGLLAVEGLATIILVDATWDRDKVLAGELFLLPLLVAFWATFVYERKGLSTADDPDAEGDNDRGLAERVGDALQEFQEYLLRSEFVSRTLLGVVAISVLSLALVAFGLPAEDVAIATLALIGLAPTAWLVLILIDNPSKRGHLNPDSIPFTPRGQLLITALLPVAAVGPSILLDSGWVFVSLMTAVVLNAALWRVAVISEKFIWYGLAIFISIQLFGTITAVARNIDDPQVQPVALIRQQDGPDEAIQGIYVTETDDRVYFATVATEGCTDELTPNSGRLLWVPREDVVAMSTGPPQSVDDAAKTALEMSYALTPAVETPAGDHVSLTVAEKRDEARKPSEEPQARRLEDVGPAVQPNFGRGLRLVPENASPGDKVTLRMAAPNLNGEVKGFGPSRSGRTVRLGGVPVDILKETAHRPDEAEYVETVNEQPLTLEKGVLYVREGDAFIEADDPDLDEEPVFVKLTDEGVVELTDHGPNGDNFLLLETTDDGIPVLAKIDGKPPRVELEDGAKRYLSRSLLRQAWHEEHIKFRVPEHGTTGAITVECEQLAGQPLLRVERPPRASISVRIEPGSRRVVFDSSRSTDNSRIVSRQWLVEGVDRGKATRISTTLPPRPQSYVVRLKVTDAEGQTGSAELQLLRLSEHFVPRPSGPKHSKLIEKARVELRQAIAATPAASIEFEMRPGELPAPPNPEKTIGRAERVRAALLGIGAAEPVGPRASDEVPTKTLAFGRACPAERRSRAGRLDVLILGEGVRVVPPRRVSGDSLPHGSPRAAIIPAMPNPADKNSLHFPAADYGNPDPEWLKIDWREHLHTVDLPGAEAVNYVEIGEGEPILFVHGIAGCWRNWLENLPHFGHHYRAIALDLPGFGDSPLPSWEISMANYGRLIHDFCERLGIDQAAALVGNSMGGFISTEAVIEEPTRFERLVLISAAGISFAEWQGRTFDATGRVVKAAIPFLSGDRRVYWTRPRGRKVAFGRLFRNPNKLRPELLAEQVRPGLQAPAFSEALTKIWGYDTRKRLPEIEIPTMVVWGLNDQIVPVEGALGYHRLIPHSRLELFERTGHLPMLERPARFNPLLEEFIESSRPLETAGLDDTAIG